MKISCFSWNFYPLILATVDGFSITESLITVEVAKWWFFFLILLLILFLIGWHSIVRNILFSPFIHSFIYSTMDLWIILFIRFEPITLMIYFGAQIVPGLASGSSCVLWTCCRDSSNISLLLWHKKIVQTCLVLLLPRSWIQPFLKRASALKRKVTYSF